MIGGCGIWDAIRSRCTAGCRATGGQSPRMCSLADGSRRRRRRVVVGVGVVVAMTVATVVTALCGLV